MKTAAPIFVVVTVGLFVIAVSGAARAEGRSTGFYVPVPQSPKPVTGTIICRGGPALVWEKREIEESTEESTNAPAPAPALTKRQVIRFYFKSSRDPTGPRGLGLKDHSECGFLDRPWPSEYPVHIVFDAASAEFDVRSGVSGVHSRRSSIQEYLTDINHFWSFDVQLKGYYFDATSHQRLEVPILTEAGNTPGNVKAKTSGQANAHASSRGSIHQATATPPDQAKMPPAAAATARTTASEADKRGIIIVGGKTLRPGSDVSLNPQPLPPKAAPAVNQVDTPLTVSRASPNLATATTAVTDRAKMPTAVAGSLDARLIEIRCRGGFGPKSFDKPASLQKLSASTVVLRLYFARNSARPDELGRGLEPGKCAPGDQAWSWEQIPFSASGYTAYIVFETAAAPGTEQNVKRSLHRTTSSATAAQRPDELTIPEYMADPAHYWRFFITKGDGRGSLFASRHERWLPGAPVSVSNPSALQVRNRELQITDEMRIAKLTTVKVSPTIGGVGFRFIARPGAEPTIDLDSGEPVTGRDGLKVLPKPLTLRAERDVRGGSSDAVNWYAAATAGEPMQLVQNTDYNYIITVPGDGVVPIQQHSGKFRTLQRLLRVRFKSIHVIDDSDDLSDGEGSFTYCVDGGGRSSPRAYEYGGKSENQQDVPAFATGTDVAVNREIVFDRWEDGPLQIAVAGIDDDSSGEYIRDAYCSATQPQTDGTADQNIARIEIDTRSPHLSGRRGATGFRMQSLQGGRLAFSVAVELEVLRPL